MALWRVARICLDQVSLLSKMTPRYFAKFLHSIGKELTMSPRGVRMRRENKTASDFSLVDLKSALGVPIEDNSSKSVYARGAVIYNLGSLKEADVVGILGSENFFIDRNVLTVQIEERRREFGPLGDT